MANLSNINGKFVVEQTTGYVGIGITDPSQLLHLQSTADTILKIDNITSGTGKSYLLRSTTAGSFIIRDEDASSNRLLINTSGNATFAGTIGSGAITSTSAVTGTRLVANGTGNAIELNQSTTGSATYYVMDNTVETGGKRYRFGYSGSSSDKGSFSIYNQTDSVMPLLLSGANATFAGNVNLPANKYILIGTDSGDAFNTSSAIRVQDTSHAYVQMKVGNSSQGGFLIGNTTDDYLGGFTYSNSSESLVFKTANTDALTITGAGNATFAGAGTFTGSLTVTAGAIRLTGANQYYYAATGTNSGLWVEDNFALRFGTNNTQRLIISNTGNATFTATVTAPTFSGDLNGTINTVTTATTKGNSTNDTTVATTAFVQNVIGTIPAGLVFQGTWNASTNSPTLTSGSGTTGNFYIVSVAGSTNLDGITDWQVGDWAVFIEQGASDQWEKIDNSSVLSGSGTGGSFAGWSGSGTSVTLGNAPVTFSGNNSTFAGNISAGSGTFSAFVYAEDEIHLTDAGTTRAKLLLNSSDRDNVELRAESLGSTMKFFTVGTEALELDASQNATFGGVLTINPGSSTVATETFRRDTAGDNQIIGDINFNTTAAEGTDDRISLIRSRTSGGAATSRGGELLFYTRKSGSADFNLTTYDRNGDWTFPGSVTFTSNIYADRYYADTTTKQTDALFIGRQNGNIVEFGHNNQSAQYYGVLGVQGSSGYPFVGFSCDIDYGANTFTTRGAKGNVIQGSGGNLSFQTVDNTNASGQTPSTRMVIQNGGNIGIGTDSPECKLTVADSGSGGVNPSTISSNTVATFRRTGGVSHNANISILAGTSGASILNFGDRDNEDAGIITYTHDSGGSDTMAFTVGTSEKMRIINSGNVGIGTTSPSAPLEIYQGGSGKVTLLQLARPNTAGLQSNIQFTVADIMVGQIQHEYEASNLNHMSFTLRAVNGSDIIPLWLENSGNVGIGTTSPAQKLQVSGNTYVTGYVQASSALIGLKNGYATLGSNSTTTGIALSRDFLPSSYPDLIINSSGNVGIGTISPATKLQVSKAGEVIVRSSMTAADGYRGGFEADNQHTGGTIWSMFSTNNSDGYFGGGKYVIANESMGGVDANTAAKFVIDGGGSVGINEIAPGTYYGDQLVVACPDENGITIMGTASNQKQYLCWASNSTGANAYAGFIAYDHNTNSMSFATNGGAGAITIDNAQNVGIGTDSPGTKLEIYGNTSSSGFGVYPALTIKNDNASGYSAIHFNQSTNQKARIEISNSAGSMGLYTTSGANGILINSSGNVGIGTTSPGSKLEIFGGGNTLRMDSAGNTAKTFLMRNVNTATAEIKTDGNLDINIEDASRTMRFLNGNTERMRIESTGVVKFPNTATSTGDVGTIAHYTNNYMYIRGGTSGLAIGDDGFGVSVYLNNSDSIQFNTGNGTEKMRIDSSGQIIFKGTGNSVDLRFKDISAAISSETAGYIGMSTSGYSGNNGDLVLIPRTSSASNILLMQGNVGIGTTTPGAKLQVKVGSAFPLHAGNACGNVGIGVTSTDISGNGLQPQLTVKGNISYGYNNYSSVANTWSNALNFSGYPAGLYQVNICKQSNASAYIIAQVKWSGTAGTVINTVTSFQYGITFSGTQLQSIINTTTATSISVQCLVTFESCLP